MWDVGPWNTKDDYWNPKREQWGDLQQGTPEAQVAFRNGYNGGKDGFGRKVANPAGIDLGDGTFWDDLGLINNTTVTVDYLWTGPTRLAKVVDTGPVYASPAQDADVVGVVADDAGVPVECATDGWVRIGEGQYLPADGGVRRRVDQAVRVHFGHGGGARPGHFRLAFPRGHTGAVDSGRTSAHVADGGVAGRRRHGRGDRQRHGRAADGRCSRSSSPSPCVVGVNYANDYSDGIRGTDDDRVGPARLVGSRAAAPTTVRTAAFLCFAVAGSGRADARLAVAGSGG